MIYNKHFNFFSMKKKITLHAFCVAIFALGAMAMNAQVGANLLKNPGFEDGPKVGDVVNGITLTAGATATTGYLLQMPDIWQSVPESWFESYYGTDDKTWTDAPDPMKNPRADYDWFNANSKNIMDVLSDNLVARIPEAGTGGMYQLVDVTPGAIYEYGCNVSMRLNNATNDCLKGDETLKILSADGLTLYDEVPINEDDAQVVDGPNPAIANGKGYLWVGDNGIKGKLTIPAGVTEVRFQFDQRNFPLKSAGGIGNSPVMVVDNCYFQLFEGTELKTPQVNASISVSPNPAITDITVSGTVSGAKIKLFSVGGALLQTIPAQENSTGIDVSSLPQGLYLLQTEGQTLKFIKK